MAKSFDIEIETGLKHNIRELEKKLVCTNKKTYLLVPNQTEKGKYKNIKCCILVELGINKIFNYITK